MLSPLNKIQQRQYSVAPSTQLIVENPIVCGTTLFHRIMITKDTTTIITKQYPA